MRATSAARSLRSADRARSRQAEVLHIKLTYYYNNNKYREEYTYAGERAAARGGTAARGGGGSGPVAVAALQTYVSN
jgi:hypothetical protein